MAKALRRAPHKSRRSAALPQDRLARLEAVGPLYDFARWVFPAHPWVDRIHRPLSMVYERHLRHVLRWRGKRGRGVKQRITLCLMPRFSLKTTLGVRAFCLWALTIEPNLRIALCSRRENLSRVSLGVIKRAFEGAGPYVERYGVQRPDARTVDMRLGWAMDGILIRARTDLLIAERSIEVMGVRTVDPGYHYDIGIWDDPHGDDSPKEIEETKNAMRNFMPILEPWGSYPITMTVWDEYDVPQMIEDEWSEDLAEPVINEPACDPEFTESFMPELLPLDALLAYHRKMGSYRACCQFALVRQSPDQQRFPPTLYREERIERREAEWVAITVDPRFGGRAGEGSRDAIVVGAWLAGGHFHMLDCATGYWDEDELLDRVIAKIKLWRPEVLGIEKNAVEQFLKVGLEKRLRLLSPLCGERRPRYEPLHHGYESKVKRIRWMVDPYKNGEMTFSPDMEAKQEWKAEFFRFRGNRDDIQDLCDAAAYQFSLAKDRLPADRAPVSAALQRRIEARDWYDKIISGRSGELAYMQKERAWTSV